VDDRLIKDSLHFLAFLSLGSNPKLLSLTGRSIGGTANRDPLARSFHASQTWI